MNPVCRKTSELLGRYLDRELGQTSAAQVAAHLESCARCREELATLSRLHELVGQDKGPRLADDYWDWHRSQVWRRIRAGRRERLDRSRSGGPFFWLRLGTVAAGAAVLVLVVLVGSRVFERTPLSTVSPLVTAEAPADRDKAESGKRGKEPATRMAARPGTVTSSSLDEEEASTAAKKPAMADRLAGRTDELAEGGSLGGQAAGAAASKGRQYALQEEAPEAAPAPLQGYALDSCDRAAELARIPDLPTVMAPDTATVLVRALVELDGTVLETQVERSSGVVLLDSIASQNVRQAVFHPGLRQGRPARCWTVVPQVFSPEKQEPAEK